MDTQPEHMAFPAFALGVSLAVLVVIVGGAYLLGDGFPAQALVVVLGASGMAVVWATLAVGDARTAQITRSAAQDLDRDPELELIFTSPVPTAPCTVWVMGAVGECPRGLKVGDRIVIEADGRLSRPLCQTAAGAIAPLLAKASGAQGFAPEVRCACPRAPRALSFSPRPTVRVGVN